MDHAVAPVPVSVPATDVRMVVLRHAHHAQASGYDRLADYIQSTEIRPRQSWSFVERAAARLSRPLIARSEVQWYHRAEFMAELRAASSWHKPGSRIYHFLYGENSYRYLGLLNRTGRHNPIVCTFHTPRRRFEEVVRTKKHLFGVDACIVLTSEMQEYFSEIVGPDRVFHVPHGVDASHFSPAATSPGSRKDVHECLAVGSHMRDFDVLYSTATYLAERAPEVRLTIVAGKGGLGRFESLPNVSVRRQVPDAELLSIYRRSSVFLLPVREVTANNALLEAMACGLPVVATDLPGVRDYVDGECARLVIPGSGVDMGEAVLTVLRDECARGSMSRASRSRALQLDWTVIARQVIQVYERVL